MATLPNPNPIENVGRLQYSYIIDSALPNVTKEILSNTIYSQVNLAELSVVKSGSESFAKMGDSITYTFVIANTGNVEASNILFKDTIPNGFNYTIGSLKINSVVQSGDPNTGITIPTIPANGVTTVEFNVVVDTVPMLNPISNTAFVSYSYIYDPSVPTSKVSSASSNILPITILQARIDGIDGIIKSADKQYVTKGEIINYTIAIKNTGNVVATNVNVKDTIPEGTSFIANSFKLDGAVQPGEDITNPLGNNIGSVAAGETKTVEFKVIVNTAPDSSVLVNEARVSYLYTKNPASIDGESGEGTSQPTNVFVKYGSFNEQDGGNSKTVDKKEGTVGDTITYTIVLKNVGNVPTNNTVFKDTIPVGTTFVPSSVVLNGVELSTANPQIGISLGTVQPLSVNTIVFKVTVNTIPIPTETSNQGRVEYEFTSNPANLNGNKGIDMTTIVTTTLKYASIDKSNGGFSKVSSYKNIGVGENIRYTITAKNTGNTAAEYVIIKDDLASEVSYVEETLTVNGIANSGDIQAGVNVGAVGQNETVEVAFTVVVNSIPASGNLENKATAEYTFTVNGEQKKVTATTDVLSTSVVHGKVSVIKLANKDYADIGDEVLYTVVVKNEGNIDVNPTIIRDTVPAGTVFVEDSLAVNKISMPGADPRFGYNIGKLKENEVKTITFKVKVIDIPVNNPIKNIVDVEYSYVVDPSLPMQTMKETAEGGNTKINNANFNKAKLGFVKEVSKDYAAIGDEVEYKLTLTNRGTVDANNVMVNDTLPANLQFIPNSIKVNGVISSSNIEYGVNIGTITPGESSVVVFKAKVLSILPDSIINNIAAVRYSYIVDPNKPAINKEEVSTNSALNIRVADLKITKVSDTNIAYVENTIEYTIKVENKGNVDALNVFLVDELSSEAMFVQNSLSIDGVVRSGANIENGIILNKVAPGESKFIRFKVKFIAAPRGNMFKNVAKGEYEFIMSPNEAPIKNTVKSNTSTVIVSIYVDQNKEVAVENCPPAIVNRSNSKCLGEKAKICGAIKYTVDGSCSITDKACIGDEIRKFKMWKQKIIGAQSDLEITDIEEIESVTGELLFIRNERVKTPDTGNSTNAEGEKLTGEKEVVETVIRFTLRLITCDGDIVKREFIQIFSSFIVIEREYLGQSLIPKGCVEDIEIVSLCNGKIKLASTVLVYLTTGSSEDCGVKCKKEEMNNYMSRSNLCPNIREFLEAGQTLWKEFDVYSNLISESTNIEEILQVNGSLDVITYKIIDTPLAINTNNEGLDLNGKKMLINMLLTIKINYMEEECMGVIKRKNIKIPVGTYIIIDKNENENVCELTSFNIKTCIEDIFVYNTNDGRVFSNTTIIVKATPCVKKPLC